MWINEAEQTGALNDIRLIHDESHFTIRSRFHKGQPYKYSGEVVRGHLELPELLEMERLLKESKSPRVRKVS